MEEPMRIEGTANQFDQTPSPAPTPAPSPTLSPSQTPRRPRANQPRTPDTPARPVPAPAPTPLPRPRVAATPPPAAATPPLPAKATVDPNGSWIADAGETLKSALAPIDPAKLAARLRGDGDEVVAKLLAEVWPTIKIDGIEFGPQAQLGYEATLTQVTEAGKTRYRLSFGKDWVLGLHINSPSRSWAKKKLEGNVGLEDYGKVVDAVVMTFDSKEDAAKALGILKHEVVAQTAHEIGMLFERQTLISPSAAIATHALVGDNPLRNPLTQDRRMMPNRGDAWASGIAPSPEQREFLKTHMTGTSVTMSNQGRLRGGLDGLVADSLPFDLGKVGRGLLGADFRLDGYQTVTRTVTWPHDGQPGKLTYTLVCRDELSTREKAKASLHGLGKLGVSPQVIRDHAAVQAQVQLSWTLDRPDMTPERNVLSRGRPLADEISVQLLLSRQDTLWPVGASRTDQKRLVLTGKVVNPGLATIKRVLGGDFSGIITTKEVQHVDRSSGFKGLTSAGAGIPFLTGASLSLSVICESGANLLSK
jgi:hypothetical protein